jgi:hypothetical protein
VKRAGWLAFLTALLVAYLRWLAPSLAPYAGGADSSGYLWSARLFRHGTLSVPVRVPDRFPREATTIGAFVPLGARVRPGTTALVPTYPTGLPLHIAAANLILPDEAAVRAVLILTAAVTLALMYAFARDTGLERSWALAACAIVASSPLFVFIAVQPMSDLLATLWALAAVSCAWRARRTTAFAALAGASVGIATLVRPTNALLIVPAMLAMTIDGRDSGASESAGRRHAAFAAGALPFAIGLGAYQRWAYGHALESGYGDLSSTFAIAVVGRTLLHYVRWLPAVASWLVLAAPVAWFSSREPLARWRIVLAAWLLVVFGIYAAYPVTSEAWWTLRFVLPAMPPLVILSLAGVREIVSAATVRLRSSSAIAAATSLAIVAAAVALELRSPEFDAHRRMKDGERVYRDALAVMTTDAALESAVLMVQMTGAANYYDPDLRFIRYDEVSPDGWAALRRWQASSGTPIGAALFPFERDEIFAPGKPRFPCNWQSRGAYLYVTFWVCPP